MKKYTKKINFIEEHKAIIILLYTLAPALFFLIFFLCYYNDIKNCQNQFYCQHNYIHLESYLTLPFSLITTLLFYMPPFYFLGQMSQISAWFIAGAIQYSIISYYGIFQYLNKNIKKFFYISAFINLLIILLTIKYDNFIYFKIINL